MSESDIVEIENPPGLPEDLPGDTAPASRSTPLRRSIAEGVAAAKANVRPAVALWLLGLSILGAYYFTDTGRAGLERVAAVRDTYGLLYAVLATAMFGGLIPWLVMRSRPRSRARATAGLLVFMNVLWMIKGVEVHALYAGLAWLLGDTNELPVILGKVALDQGVYAPLYAAPSLLLAYRLHDGGYRLRSLGVVASRRWWLDKALPVILANSAVWTPAVAMIYALPLALQLPMQNLVLCFWSLILVFMTDPDRQR
ncbi:MAG: hypothetical protein ACOC3G_02000 [Phycisphaeraceae bacterium]